ncbi:MAG: AAA family ATPase [Desulfurococcales archaeon]|nr:AAA family ATPase [Desulfurococcales archaeon]
MTGTPGTGKTTFARKLSSELNCETISTSRLAVELGLVERDPTGRATHVLLPGAGGRLARHICDIDRTVGCLIVETTYADLLLEDECINSGTVLIVLLRAHPSILLDRLARRGWPPGKVLENVEAELANAVGASLSAYADETVEVDTSLSTPSDTVDMMFYKLEVWDWNTGIRIDWTRDSEALETVSRLSLSIDLDQYRLPL